MIDRETLARLGWSEELIQAVLAVEAGIRWHEFVDKIPVTVSEAALLESVRVEFSQRPTVATDDVRLTTK